MHPHERERERERWREGERDCERVGEREKGRTIAPLLPPTRERDPR